MKKIGIIFAMQEELTELKKYLSIEKEYDIFELHFYEGTIENTNCVLVECGIGKVNAARTTQILIDNIKVDYVINIGVAGGVDKELNVGDIVIGEKLVQHDFDITAFDHEKGFIPNVGKYIECDKELVEIAKKSIIKTENSNVKTGVIASGDIFCTDPKMGEKINTKFEALCVEMEGASIAQVCYLNKTPFIIIRSISDSPSNDNNITFDEFLTNSSKIIAESMKEFLKELN